MQSVLEKLNLTTDQLNSLYSACPVGGYVGADVAQCLAVRFGLTLTEPLGQQLCDLDILTVAEAAWMDD